MSICVFRNFEAFCKTLNDILMAFSKIRYFYFILITYLGIVILLYETRRIKLLERKSPKDNIIDIIFQVEKQTELVDLAFEECRTARKMRARTLQFRCESEFPKTSKRSKRKHFHALHHRQVHNNSSGTSIKYTGKLNFNVTIDYLYKCVL